MDELESHEFLTYYYRSPAPERAPEVIRGYAASSLVEDPLSAIPAAYFFARMAQENPDLVGKFETLWRETPNPGKTFIFRVLHDLKSNPAGPVNALDRVVRTATDNDLLWAEFVLTGSKEPILRLIDLLQSPDIIREKLDSWLAASSPKLLEVGWSRERTCELIRSTAGIVFDLKLNKIETSGDLDCLCLMQGLDLAPSGRFNEICRALPFELSHGEIDEIGAKSTAKWSLASNANRHPAVQATCEEELERRTGGIKTALQEIVDFARLNSADYAEAMGLRQEADDDNTEAQCKLGLMYKIGQGVHRSEQLAIYWLGRSANLANAEAQYELAVVLWEAGGNIYGEDVSGWLEAAAEQGYAEAQYQLGRVISDDDLPEARKWLTAAAEQDHPGACMELCCFEIEYGGEIDGGVK